MNQPSEVVSRARRRFPRVGLDHTHERLGKMANRVVAKATANRVGMSNSSRSLTAKFMVNQKFATYGEANHGMFY